MTNSLYSGQKNSLSFRVVLIIGALILGFSFLLHVAFQHGDGTAYSTGYEMGGMMAKIFSTGLFKNGIGLGSLIAVLASWERNKSILWAILHAVFGWIYVFYFAFTRNATKLNTN